MIDAAGAVEQLDALIADIDADIEAAIRRRDGLRRIRDGLVAAESEPGWLTRKQIAARLKIKPSSVRRAIQRVSRDFPPETKRIGPRAETAYREEWVLSHLSAP